MARSTRARSAAKSGGAEAAAAPRRGRLRRIARWAGLLALVPVGIVVLGVLLLAVVPPPSTPYMMAESRRLGGVAQSWVSMDEIAPVMARSVVVGEDAAFCEHWGFDIRAIRAALAQGADRGASTISQQVAKNVFLWQGRSWPRKALEALITPLIEAVWSKRRILEVYLNVAEMGKGVFGVEAAARRYFGVAAADLSADQAARLTVILPDPKRRMPGDLDAGLGRRAAMVRDGAALIARDGRAACFEGGAGSG